ncbi:MAG: UUP1 family membrane protein [Paracoccaceae bacterium]
MGLRLLCITLVLVGLSLFLWRWQVLGFPLTPEEDGSLWAVEAQIDLEGEGEPARVGLFIPVLDEGYGVVTEDFISSRFALTTQTDQIGNRAAVWSTGSLDGRASVIYRGLYVAAPNLDQDGPQADPPAELPEGLRYPPERSDNQREAADRLAEATREEAFDLHNQVALLLERLTASGGAGVFVAGEPSPRDVAEAAAYVLSRQETPARAVLGIPLEGRTRSVTPIPWLEVWTGDDWESFDPASGDPFEPTRRIVWWRGSGDLLQVEGADVTRQSFALSEQRIGALASLTERSNLIDDPVASLTLFDLSVNTQLVFETLLMVPIGALLLVIMRQVVGVETIGTFMPVLIALAFQVTDLLYGIMFFTGLVAAGLLIRFVFAQLNLLLVPRLAAMLVVVILIMIGFSLLADAVSLGLGLSVALFPIVILTMTIERMSVTWEENGPGEAMKQGLGSLVIAVMAYVVMNIETLRHLFFVFPELLLLILAAMLMLGRYSGYRLTELYRFRDLARQQS